MFLVIQSLPSVVVTALFIAAHSSGLKTRTGEKSCVGLTENPYGVQRMSHQFPQIAHAEKVDVAVVVCSQPDPACSYCLGRLRLTIAWPLYHGLQGSSAMWERHQHHRNRDWPLDLGWVSCSAMSQWGCQQHCVHSLSLSFAKLLCTMCPMRAGFIFMEACYI